MPKKVTMDGNEAAAYAAYAFTEVAAIYPITPASPMAEHIDEWSAQGKLNLFGQKVTLVQMQSEAGAAGAMHGSLEAGALATTFTASQGLLLMIPNLYKMTGELLPGVLHVAARAISTHALSIFGDHQDVMACRQTGTAMLAAANAQEAMDLGCIAHLSAIEAKWPFIHFFDGFRTSHEYRNIELIDYEDLKTLLNWEAVQSFRNRSLNPTNPLVKGTAQNPDIYFQGRELQNSYFARIPDIVNEYMQKWSKLTGRSYKPFDYYGASDAQDIIIAMGSVCDTIKETVDYLNKKGNKTGFIQVRLYRPFSGRYFHQVLPVSVKRIAVLDRTKEPGAPGEPLYLDVCSHFVGRPDAPLIVGGRYGLSSKDTTPQQILAVFNNLSASRPKNSFTIGIIDDLTGTSLPEDNSFSPPANGNISCKFWGLGSDGTVGANKLACKIIGEHTDLNVQAYFDYDSKKSGGTTVSHLRFGRHPILSTYLINAADYIACHNQSFLNHFNVVAGLNPGGIFLLNCEYEPDKIGQYLPARLKQYLAQNNIQFYIINANKIAAEIGLGNRINMIMQAAFFKLTNIIDVQEAVRLLKASVDKSYARKGSDIVAMNYAAIEKGIESIIKINVPAQWVHEKDEERARPVNDPDFIHRIQRVMARNEGHLLPVSAFAGMEDGAFPLGITAYEKRGIAPFVPEWQIDKCIQCGRCAYICPHATIRLFLLNDVEQKKAPSAFKTKKAVGKELSPYQFRVQVSPLDCTGCGNCADICPAPGKALIMKPAAEQIKNQADNWEYAMNITEKAEDINRHTIKGSQFMRPLLEFSGACPGCGETPYVRLLTQLFGERMMIANATGCSSIWAASAPAIAYTTNADGRGPAWGNSLFEDNAEYGYGMFLGVRQIRRRLKELVREAIKQNISPDLREAFIGWLENADQGDESLKWAKKITMALGKNDIQTNKILQEINSYKIYLEKRSIWMIGGDGWAYDIGYGGLDHVLAIGDDVNILVMDTEVYSNTGGQASKATPAGAVAKFAYSGKANRKKDLGLMAMTYGDVYVAQVAMGADMNQTLKSFIEAESYPGPSLIIAYSPCISHGIKTGMSSSIEEERRAVEAGYWHLYRYDPRLKEIGKNPFQLDSKDPTRSYQDFLEGEIRFAQLANTFPDKAEKLFKESERFARERLAVYKRLANLE